VRRISRGPLGDVEGAQEHQITDFERAILALRAQRLRQQVEIAGAGQERLTVFGAVLIEYPMGGGTVACVKDAVALGVKAALIDERLIDRQARGGGGRAALPRHGLGGHADLGPDAPVERQNTGAPARPRPGIGVEIFVGGDVIDLARGGGGG
jgi:hypothetical protein